MPHSARVTLVMPRDSNESRGPLYSPVPVKCTCAALASTRHPNLRHVWRIRALTNLAEALRSSGTYPCV